MRRSILETRMTLNSKFYKAILLLVAATFLVSVGMSQRYLNRQRDALGLTRVAPLEIRAVLALTCVNWADFAA